MSKQPTIFIFGAGPYADLLRNLAEDAGRKVGGFVVDPGWRHGNSFEGLPLNEWDAGQAEHGEWLVALGYRSMHSRAAVADRIEAAGGQLATLISPDALVARTATLGPGAVIFPGAIVEHRVNVGRNVTLWSSGVIHHGSTVGSDCYLAPVNIAGDCRVGRGCFFGMRATVIDAVSIGDGCRIDAGSLVTGDAAANGHYRGSPARRIAEIDPSVGIAISRD